MKHLTTLLLICILGSINLDLGAQVGIGILIPDTTAILHLESNNRGFLLPRMTTTDRNGINAPATGLMIYNTTDSVPQYWNGVCWLNVYQENCTDCYFNMALSQIADTIDRTVTDSSTVQVNITQTAGTPQQVAFWVMSQLPQGMTYTINPNPLFSSGSVNVTFHVTPFTPAGVYPMVIQALCGPSVHNIIYTITVEPCYILDVLNNINNYSISTDLYNTYPSAPVNSPVCVVSIVHPGITVSSPNTANPAYTTGSLPAGSVVAIVNDGMIIGKGGDGGIAYDPTQGLSGNGFDGGHAINLTLPTSILNNGYIFGGGGGGGSMAFRIGIQLGPVFLGFLIGSGGGGGAGGGLGGNTPAVVGISYYSQGTNGTTGLFGVPGQGGILNFPILFALGPVNITINPNAIGGNGGPYGYPGTQGIFQVTLSASMVINIPFVGPVTIPIVTNINLPMPVPPPNPGQAGNAIKRNGNSTNIPDNSYNTSFLKGVVGF